MILAIDGASTDLSIALAGPDGTLLAEDAWRGEQRQSAELLPHVLALLEGAGLRTTDLSALAIGTGPGSFTGLRVAMARGRPGCGCRRRPSRRPGGVPPATP